MVSFFQTFTLPPSPILVEARLHSNIDPAPIASFWPGTLVEHTEHLRPSGTKTYDL